MAWGNPEQLDVDRNLVDRFNSVNPGVHVDLLVVPGSSYGYKSTLMMATATAPDVLRVDHYNFPHLVRCGYFTDLTPYAQADNAFHATDFWPETIRECEFDGRLYGLNVLFGGIVLYYNKALIKAAGLEDPYEAYKHGRWTWERFRRYAKTMTSFAADREPRTFGTLVPGLPTITLFLRGFGGE
jgi:multiple sugar transport system substrate-binding protein